ncbi:uncharacterized protein LOC131176775 [Hevea brasiliensis]|uniref:uncharacterized protein LOC131176775 n=1 Tax=Hevea brasiliensis TaxID=3981 RepID=UPI0025ED29CD|nr:uncharacterized protein LOC131176775 [Hevea brasiliensis]
MSNALSRIDTKKKVNLKLLIDKKTNKVLFAEAEKDFVDFLFILLSLPVGTAGRIVYVCLNYHHRCVTARRGAPCSKCSASTTYELPFIGTNNNNTSASNTATSSSEEGFMKGMVTYMVTDDLSVSPMSMISGVALLNKFNVKGFSALKGKMVEFGIDEGLELLKASLQSKAALTSVSLLRMRSRIEVLVFLVAICVFGGTLGVIRRDSTFNWVSSLSRKDKDRHRI